MFFSFLIKSKPRNLLKVCNSVLTRSYHLKYSPNAQLDKTILDRYLCLPIPECKVQAKYVWIDGTGEHVRSKSRTLDFIPSCYKECPNWSFDGSSTYQKEGKYSDVYLVPCAMYSDPIRRGNNKIILCETYTHEHKPTKSNFRHKCSEVLDAVCEHDPMFGLEQEYQIMDVDNRPFGWPAMLGEPGAVGAYYCGVGGDRAYAREIVEAHYRCCLYMGIDIGGTNAEVTPSQWEFQTGPTIGIKAADDLWMARFMLYRIAEEFGLTISLHPKLFPNWNGAGCHTNFSTKEMRDEGGIKAVEDAICKLEKKHKEHIKVYDPRGGFDNIQRLTGRHETSSVEKFSWGVGDRSGSVRIPLAVAAAKKGFLEDRRPSSNCDPYQVITALICTCLLDK